MDEQNGQQPYRTAIKYQAHGNRLNGVNYQKWGKKKDVFIGFVQRKKQNAGKYEMSTEICIE